MTVSQEPEDVKPKINLTVAYGEDSITVKVRPNMLFAKVFDAAEVNQKLFKRFGKEPGTLKFTYDGERVNRDATPASLGMEDGDQIDAFLEQVGGGHSD